jgi:hypothetical protein
MSDRLRGTGANGNAGSDVIKPQLAMNQPIEVAAADSRSAQKACDFQRVPHASGQNGLVGEPCSDQDPISSIGDGHGLFAGEGIHCARTHGRGRAHPA